MSHIPIWKYYLVFFRRDAYYAGNKVHKLHHLYFIETTKGSSNEKKKTFRVSFGLYKIGEKQI